LFIVDIREIQGFQLRIVRGGNDSLVSVFLSSQERHSVPTVVKATGTPGHIEYSVDAKAVKDLLHGRFELQTQQSRFEPCPTLASLRQVSRSFSGDHCS
jgi:hypothetical protein